MLTVNEIFHSIQGESSHSGRPCVFVRLTACDLRCTWCDTPYAFDEGVKRTVADVAAMVGTYPCQLVEITGGEPLLQDDVYPLMDRLLADGKTVLLEVGPVVPRGLAARGNHWPNLEQLAPHDEVKFVIQNRTDYDYACDTLRRHDLVARCATVLFSPVHRVLTPEQLAEWALADGLPVRVQVQLHKYLWGDDTRGV